MSDVFTVVAPVNIAVIKYWGKRDEELIIPLNDSVSATLDTNIMCAKTSVYASPQITEDEIWLNSERTTFNTRMQNCLREIKTRAATENTVAKDILLWKIRVCSVNNFPTAAGLASSAAGYACLVSALAKLYKVKSDVSSIARMGSGSACRSVYGGFVQWHEGTDKWGKDSIATQVVDSTHWPEMRVLILVVGESKKDTGSTVGMRNSVKTSELLKYRVEHCVPERTKNIINAIKERNFKNFGEITMKDSNQFHAICQDTYPPCVYLNDTSQTIIKLIHEYNEVWGVKVAYTFDAGPNACLYLLDEEVPKVISLIQHIFPSSKEDSYITGLQSDNHQLEPEFLSKIKVPKQKQDLIKYIIHTKIGEGPTEINDDSHLIDKLGNKIN